jgi:hypothetical protein
MILDLFSGKVWKGLVKAGYNGMGVLACIQVVTTCDGVSHRSLVCGRD